MNIIHVIEASATGTLAMCQLLSNDQANRGYNVTVLFSRRPETPKNIESYFDARVSVVNIQMSSLKDKFFCLFKINSIIRRLDADVVYLHSSFAGFLGRISLILDSRKRRILYIPHCISFMRKDIGMLKKWIFIAFEVIGGLKRCEYIACSESERSEISKYIKFRNCHLVENAIFYDGDPNDLSISENSIITVGQIRTQKGPHQFCEIMKCVQRDRPDAKFIWVGDGDVNLRKELEAAGVYVTGWLNKSEVMEYLKRSKVYLSTALWEGMPVSIIEAMYSGMYVVANQCAGNVDVIDDGVTGWIFKKNQEAADIICDCLNGRNYNVTINARNMAVSRFSMGRYLSQMDELIKIEKN